MSGKVVVVIAVIVVVLILAAGISTMWVGGEVSRKWSNRLMQYRVAAQAVAFAIILLVLYISGQH